MQKRKGGIVGFIFFMVVLTIFASGAVAVYIIFLKPEAKSKVPQLVGLSTTEAVAQAENLGLIIQLQPVASTLPEGRILAQSPQPGTELRKGLVIVLHESQGGTVHTVPDVKGKTLSEAQREIKSSGFNLGDVIKIREGDFKAGTVIAQSPSAPASVTSGRKIDLLIQDGAASSEVVTVPDVNRMTETEARNLLETNGIKVQAVDRVYSPLLPEGLAIETRPGAGSTLRTGQGVTLKLATQRRPAGFMDANTSSSSNSNGNVRRVTSQQSENQNTAQIPTSSKTQTQTSNSNRGVTVSVGGQDDVFIGDDYSTTPATTTTPARTQTPSRASTTPQQTQSSQASNSGSNSTPAPSTASSASSGGGSKTARIRYVVPPIARPMDLRIEVTDPSGKREIMNRQVRSGESINTTAKYSQECVISIYLGGEFVWQERQR